jgi:hypothetical protein
VEPKAARGCCRRPISHDPSKGSLTGSGKTKKDPYSVIPAQAGIQKGIEHIEGEFPGLQLSRESRAFFRSLLNGAGYVSLVPSFGFHIEIFPRNLPGDYALQGVLNAGQLRLQRRT